MFPDSFKHDLAQNLLRRRVSPESRDGLVQGTLPPRRGGIGGSHRSWRRRRRHRRVHPNLSMGVLKSDVLNRHGELRYQC